MASNSNRAGTGGAPPPAPKPTKPKGKKTASIKPKTSNA